MQMCMRTIKVYLREHNSEKKTGVIWISFYVNRQKVNFSTGVCCHTKHWNKSKEQISSGDIMPISPIDGCASEHWAEVLAILKESVELAGFEPNLVSDADDSGIIQKRIIQNLYSNEIVICDVSAKNPNVMFELGMRLAFDKPTIIVKDDKTDYSFDTSVIEHLNYPRDLRFAKIMSFKDALKKKIQGTYKAANNANYTTFLKHFGEYKVAQIVEKEVTSDKYILSMLEDLRYEVSSIRRTQNVNMSRTQQNLFELGVSPSPDAEGIVRKRMERFRKLKKINTISVLDKELIEELVEYLEKFEDVRASCGSPEILREVIGRQLPPF